MWLKNISISNKKRKKIRKLFNISPMIIFVKLRQFLQNIYAKIATIYLLITIKKDTLNMYTKKVH